METPAITMPAHGAAASGESQDLMSLAAKAAAGDWISECLTLFSEASRSEFKLQSTCVVRRQRKMQEARKIHEKMLELKKRASKRSGIAEFFSYVAGAVTAAVSAVVSLYCPPAAIGIGIGGAIVTGSSMVASALENQTATGYQGRAMQADLACQEASEARSEILTAMQESVHVEQKMMERLNELADSEYRIGQSAIYSQGRE